MFLFTLWVYTLIIIVIWAFFIVIRLHAIKFANFQSSIRKLLKILFIFLLVFTILWYIILFSIDFDHKISTVKDIWDLNIEKSLDNLDSNYY